MSRKEIVWFWGLVLSLAILMGLVSFRLASGADDPAYASPQLEQCIGATCKVVAEDGSTGTGVIYGTGVRQGRRYVVVATAAHIVRGAARVTCFIGRTALRVTGTVIVQNRRTDAGCVIVPIEQFGEQIQIAHQRQIRTQHVPRQFRAPLLKPLNEVLRHP